MKDLKIVIAIAVPLVLVAGGLWALQEFLGPAIDDPDVVGPGPAEPYAGGGTNSGGNPPLHDGPVPRTEWPKEPGAGPPQVGPREVFDDVETPTLTLELLRSLLAKGDDPSYRKIEFLLRQGEVEEPFEVAKILMEHIGKGGNSGVWCARLLPLLKDERVRERIATGLLASLSEQKDRNGIVAAIEVIGKVGGPENIPALVEITKKHEMRDAVVRALYAMADIGGAEAAGGLVAYLTDHAGEKNEDIALKAIEKLKTDDMVTAIDGLLGTDQPAETRVLGVKALGRAAGTAAATKRLLELAKEGGDVGRAAGLQLGLVTGREATEPFIERVDDEKDVHRKAGMVTALGTNGSEPARAKCFDVLADKDEFSTVRAAGAMSLAKSGDDRGVTVMLDIVSYPREETRTLDRKVVSAVRTLALKNRKAARDLSAKFLPIFKKRLEDNPRDSSANEMKHTILVLEQLGG